MYALPITNSGGFLDTSLLSLSYKSVAPCSKQLKHSTNRPTLFNGAMQICTCWHQVHYRLYIQILHIGHKKSNICGWGYKLIALTEVTNIGNMCFSP